MVNKLDGYFMSKISQLELAHNFELNPPKSFFTNDLTLLDRKSVYIHKPASNLGYVKGEGGVFAAYTELLATDLKLQKLFPSFIQEKLDALYEIRITYCNNLIYACGMIKSGDESNIDVKEQDSVRYSPVIIPEEYQRKIKAFMKAIGFKIGSLDIIKSKKNYHFLEMNPIGKFAFYSDVGVFGIEEKIADLLIERE